MLLMTSYVVNIAGNFQPNLVYRLNIPLLKRVGSAENRPHGNLHPLSSLHLVRPRMNYATLYINAGKGVHSHRLGWSSPVRKS